MMLPQIRIAYNTKWIYHDKIKSELELILMCAKLHGLTAVTDFFMPFDAVVCVHTLF